MKKTEQLILEYFKLINPLPYDEVKVETVLIVLSGIVVIKIYTKDSVSYMVNRGRERSVLSKIKIDMNDMFPYVFHIYCKSDYKIKSLGS
jgi:hypothetical protein